MRKGGRLGLMKGLTCVPLGQATNSFVPFPGPSAVLARQMTLVQAEKRARFAYTSRLVSWEGSTLDKGQRERSTNQSPTTRGRLDVTSAMSHACLTSYARRVFLVSFFVRDLSIQGVVRFGAIGPASWDSAVVTLAKLLDIFELGLPRSKFCS